MHKSKLWKDYFSVLKIPKVKLKNFKKEDVNYKISLTDPNRLGFFLLQIAINEYGKKII